MELKEAYYERSEVSNSDLTTLKYLLYPCIQYGNKEAIFKFGRLVDAFITEPEKLNHIRLEVAGEPYQLADWEMAKEMKQALDREASHDPFLMYVLTHASTQRSMWRHFQHFQYCGINFTLNTRCKWDWYLDDFGGDLKTTHARTQKEFDDAIDFFDWDRSRAWYMDIACADKDFIYGISKANFRVFKKFINRGDEVYQRGCEKYSELAFKWWCLN